MKRDGQKPLMNTEDDEKLVTYRIIAPLLEQVQQFRDEHLPPYAQAGKSADMVHRLIWLRGLRYAVFRFGRLRRSLS